MKQEKQPTKPPVELPSMVANDAPEIPPFAQEMIDRLRAIIDKTDQKMKESRDRVDEQVATIDREIKEVTEKIEKIGIERKENKEKLTPLQQEVAQGAPMPSGGLSQYALDLLASRAKQKALSSPPTTTAKQKEPSL